MCWILLSYQNTQDLGSSEDASLSGRQSSQNTVNGAAEKKAAHRSRSIPFEEAEKQEKVGSLPKVVGETVHTVYRKGEMV